MDDDKRLNEVIRVQKRPNNFVMIDKGFLENPGLSWKAKGILAYLLGKPDNWKVVVKDLVRHATDGKAAVYSGLNELKAHGHYSKTPVRNESGNRISHWEGVVSEVPATPVGNGEPPLLTDFQEMENQDIENQYLENREHNNNYMNNIYINKNKRSQSVSQNPVITSDYTGQIRKNIDYDGLTRARPYDRELIDEFIAVMVDAMITHSDTVVLDGEVKPRWLVVNALMKVTYDDMNHVVGRFRAFTGRIARKRQYMLTMLYNCKLEIEAHYVNEVKADMAGGMV